MRASNARGWIITTIANVRHHDHWDACRTALGNARIFAVETRQTTRYDQVQYRDGDAFVFGKGNHWLAGRRSRRHFRRTPCVAAHARRATAASELINSVVAVMVFEAWRQVGFGD